MKCKRPAVIVSPVRREMYSHVGLNDIDAKPTMESMKLFQTGQTGTWKTWDLTALTQKWANLTASNYGVVLWATNETTDGYDFRFYSSEYTTDPAKRPKLEVTYSTKAKTVYFLKDHPSTALRAGLGSIRATVLDSTGAPVRGYDDYDSWGYTLAGRSMATSLLTLQNAGKNKFTGKERDDDYGVNWDDAFFRDYDPQIGRWLSVDPLAMKYPSLSPYNYAANNPVLFVDVNGDSIWINDDGKGILYSEGMEYKGKNKSVAQLINHLNKLWGVKAGSQVLNDLMESSANYNISFDAALSTPGAFSSTGSSPGGDLSLNPGTYDSGTVAHEVFHGYQQEQGSWGESILSETEADLFSGAMRLATGDKNVVFGNPNAGYAGANYDRAMQSLVKSFNDLTFWNDAVYQFKTGSALNWKKRYVKLLDALPHQKVLI
ncbi:RHS repeat-associated core domain-containing protein, partial [Nitrosomonas nitrosa]|uniref:RHS repeat-associated core domain-containing protein n=1 Tax=Nitrosomonas nitrosa TaxID=52442 RepID=UPI0023F9FE71